MHNILTIFIAAIPLIVINYQFEVPKVFAFLILSFILTIVLIINFKKITFYKWDRYYLLWLLTLLVSGLLGNDPVTSILGGSYRHQGLIFFFGFYLVIKYLNILTQKQKTTLYKYVAVSVLIEALFVVFGFKLGTIGEINAVAGFIAIGIYFVAISFPKLFLTVPIIGILINFSKSGFLALLPYVFKKINIFLIVSIVVVAFIAKPINTNSQFESRGVIWKHAIEIIKDKPILGHGAESNEVQYDKKFLEKNMPLLNLRIDRAHNLFLDITIWSGLVGLCFFVMFLCEVFKSISFERRQVLLSFMVYSMFQPISVVHWILLALIV
ncbi:MAG: O-antigen ligase family protein [Microgenomates group bacterium]